MGKVLVRLNGWSRVVLVALGMLALWGMLAALIGGRDGVALYWGLLAAGALHRAQATR